jgi:hypothetical protein
VTVVVASGTYPGGITIAASALASLTIEGQGHGNKPPTPRQHRQPSGVTTSLDGPETSATATIETEGMAPPCPIPRRSNTRSLFVSRPVEVVQSTRDAQHPGSDAHRRGHHLVAHRGGQSRPQEQRTDSPVSTTRERCDGGP